MLEGLRRWRFERAMKRSIARGEGESIQDPEESKRRMIKMSQGARDIKVVVSPETNSPLFQALPDILRAADPDAEVKVILVMPENHIPTGDTRETLKQILEIAERRNRPDIISDEDEDLGNLDLELHGAVDSNKLAVFIQDPKNPEQYLYRRIGVEKGSMQLGSGESVPYVDMVRYPMPSLDDKPCPATNLDIGVANMVDIEAGLSTHPKQEMRDMRATVGVARYTGTNNLTASRILRLTAIKYSKMAQPAE